MGEPVVFYYRKWVALRPDKGRSCCGRSHYYKVGYNLIKPYDDDCVCERELAWREYVRARDNNRLFPFDRKCTVEERTEGDGYYDE